MKKELFDILHSDEMPEDKLDLIEELVLVPKRKMRREFTQSFRRCAEILSRMMNDYQFDPRHDDFCGFLNTSGNDGWDKDDFAFLVANISIFEGFIHRNGFTVEKGEFDEFVIRLVNLNEQVEKL